MDKPSTQKESWEEEYDRQFGFLNKIIERYAVSENHPKYNEVVNWGERIKDFTRQAITAYRAKLVERLEAEKYNSGHDHITPPKKKFPVAWNEAINRAISIIKE